MSHAEGIFPPATREEMQNRGWDRPDIIMVTGDAYIDSPLVGAAVIARVLEHAGYRVAVIPQPDTHSEKDITRLGEPKLFWGVTSGCVDSLVANYTAEKKKRKRDDYTPGIQNDRRPDRAVIVYTNLIRRYFKNTVPIVLGGMEAGSRRVAHYDFWSDSIRRSILFDAKAEVLVYGMGEQAVLDIAGRCRDGTGLEGIRGSCGISRYLPEDYIELPSYEEVCDSEEAFTRMFSLFSANNDPPTARGLGQLHGDRYLLHHPPQPVMTTRDLDDIHALPFHREVHPVHAAAGPVRAMDTIRFSIVTHRGCYGGCSFCSIALHQGRRIVSRSEASILAEASSFTRHPAFRGVISDVGGPTANMYRTGCTLDRGCTDRQCLFPSVCPNLDTDHDPQVRLLKKLRSLPGIRRIFVASGLRYDLIMAARGKDTYMKELVEHHVSGQCKVAPEHVQKNILFLMRKPRIDPLLDFKTLFDRLSRQAGKKQYLTYYFIAAHPGCRIEDMKALRRFTDDHLRLIPEQVQVFTPLPSTWSAVMYRTGKNPWTGAPIYVERDPKKRSLQKTVLVQGKRSGR